MITTQIKIQDSLKDLNMTDTASLIHVASEAVRQSCSFHRAYSDLGIYISEVDQDGFVSDHIQDIADERDLINLLIAASFRLQTLSR